MEKEQKQFRYPWDSAPEWAKFAATDFDGVPWWFEDQPFCIVGRWHVNTGKFETIEDLMFDYRDSLQSRPT
jgi:hypothetical protein